MIEFGGLVDKAELSELSTAQLFGAFLRIREQSLDSNLLTQWESEGSATFNKDKGNIITNEKAIIIKFPSEPDSDVRKKLRSFGMRWNSVRKEWEGIADPDAVKIVLNNIDMALQEITTT